MSGEMGVNMDGVVAAQHAAVSMAFDPAWRPPWPAEPEKTIHALIVEELQRHGESWSSIVAYEPPTFDASASAYAEQAWIIWTAQRVYSPLEYDGSWSVVSVPRSPAAP